jgi:hypothetical protein
LLVFWFRKLILKFPYKCGQPSSLHVFNQSFLNQERRRITYVRYSLIVKKSSSKFCWTRLFTLGWKQRQ